jgi:hypothetical protein
MVIYADFALKKCAKCADEVVVFPGYLYRSSPNQSGSTDGSGSTNAGRRLKKGERKKCQFKCLRQLDRFFMHSSGSVIRTCQCRTDTTL